MIRKNLKIWTLELCAEKTALLAVNKLAPRIYLSLFSVLLLLIGFGTSFAQVTTTAPRPTMPGTPRATPVPRPTPPRVYAPVAKPGKQIVNESDAPAEKSIKADAKVQIKLCVSEGRVKINGWNRDEIRAFVNEGTNVGFKVLKAKGQTPAWVQVLGYDPKKNPEAGLDDCLAGNDIELDVPEGASIDFRGQESELTISSVNKVVAENVSGNIMLRNIVQSTEVKTLEGGLVVEDSTGAMRLTTTNGNIVALGVEPGNVGETFTARTSSGAITLQQVGFQQIDANSNSGAIRFDGALESGGNYTFSTTSGTITLMVPVDTSCKINAIYTGSFSYEIPLKNIQKTPGNPISVTALLGEGDATLTLRTLSGSIRLRKK